MAQGPLLFPKNNPLQMHILCGEEEYKSYGWDTWKGGKRVIWVPQDQWLLCSGGSSKLKENQAITFSVVLTVFQQHWPRQLPLTYCHCVGQGSPHPACHPRLPGHAPPSPPCSCTWHPQPLTPPCLQCRDPEPADPGLARQRNFSKDRKRQNLGTYSITLAKCQEVLVQSRCVLS